MPAPKSKPFAQGTTVDPLKTLTQIDAMLTKAGAGDFDIFRRTAREGVAFVKDGIAYRVSVPMLLDEAEAKAFASRRKGTAGHGSYLAAERARRLRCLHNVVKAKLVAVEEEIYTFEEMFVNDLLTDTGETMGERAVAFVRKAVLEGRTVSALPMPGERA